MDATRLIALALAVAAAGLAGWTISTLGWTRTVWQSNELENSGKPKLVLGGPYAHVRHPLYLSVLLLSLSFAVARGGWAVWLGCLLVCIGIVYAARAEEGAMQVRFGEAYSRYRTAVPFLMPRGDGLLFRRFRKVMHTAKR